MSTFEDLKPYVKHMILDGLGGWSLGEMDSNLVQSPYALACWQSGTEPMCVAVGSTINIYNPDWLDDKEITTLATDYLEEIGWLTDGRECDRIVRSYQ